MARLPFVDTHIHLWDLKYPKLKYDWLRPQSVHPILGEADGIKVVRYSVEEYLAEVRFQNVAKAIHVQAAFGIEDPVEETLWLQALADSTGWPHGIIASCDLAAPDVAASIERHLACRNVRGFRSIEPADVFEDPSWRRGYARLADYGLVFCHEVGAERMDRAVELAASYPEVTLCIDQAGMPTQRSAEYFDNWRAAMLSVAARPNVVCKISSLGMGDNLWTVGSLRPWVLTCIEAFGAKRCFFGSNWPVDRLFSSYSDVLDAYAEIISEFSEDEQMDLLSRNAERVFNV